MENHNDNLTSILISLLFYNGFKFTHSNKWSMTNFKQRFFKLKSSEAAVQIFVIRNYNT